MNAQAKHRPMISLRTWEIIDEIRRTLPPGHRRNAIDEGTTEFLGFFSGPCGEGFFAVARSVDKIAKVRRVTYHAMSEARDSHGSIVRRSACVPNIPWEGFQGFGPVAGQGNEKLSSAIRRIARRSM